MLSTPESSPVGHAPAQSKNQRQAKLRRVCNTCCAAKVKCSGERSGCERCVNTSVPCIYAVSRVGKVPGIRAARKRAPSTERHQKSRHSPGQRQHHQGLTSTSSVAAPVSVLVSMDAGVDIDADANGHIAHHDAADLNRNRMMGWPSDWHLQSSSAADSITVIFPPEQHQQQHLNFDTSQLQNAFAMGDTYAVPDVLNTFNNVGMKPSSMNHRSEQSVTTSRDMDGYSAGRMSLSSELDSECVQECCQVISYLETYISSKMRDFKIILGILRQVLSQLVNLVSLQQVALNPRCIMLFATILYQTVSLVEVCLPHLSVEKNKKGLGAPSGFGFSGFLVDAEEQRLLRIRALTKELQRFSDVIAKIKALSVKGPGLGLHDRNGVDTVISSKTKADCFTDLENKFGVITDRISGI